MRPTTCNESQGIEIALYTQSQLDAAVAAEREECARIACQELLKGDEAIAIEVSANIRARGKHDA